MVQPSDIEALVEEIAEKFDPERIIVFGSFAYGNPSEDSDVDLLVIKRYRGSSVDAAVRIRCATEHRFPMDLLVRSPAEIRRRLAMHDYFIMDITEGGLILHEKHDQRVGQQGRRRLRHRLHPSSLKKAQPV